MATPILLAVLWAGCSPSEDKPQADGGPESGQTGSAAKGSGDPDEDGPFKLGDLVEPFAPPTLEELEKKVKWIDKPVLDGIKLLRERQAKEEPKATVAEALALRNTSPENNEKLLSAMGRLPADEAKDVDWEAAINRHGSADVKSSNPLLASSTIEFEVSSLIGMGLFGFDWTFAPFASPDTVKSWQSSEDGLYDKVVLRDDLTWSDGKPITAHDVEFSYRVIMSSQVPVPAQRSGTDKLKLVKAYDDQTVVFFHKDSLSTNVWNVNFSIIPKHAYENTIAEDPTLADSDAHVSLEDNPITGGPYVITKRTRAQEIVLERRESYYMHKGKQVRDKPYFKTIRFHVKPDQSTALLSLKAGDIDEMILNPEQWSNQTNGDDFYKNNTKVYAIEWVGFHFMWNLKTPYFSDKGVRKALAFAFDHDELLSKLRYGIDQPSNGLFNGESRWAAKGDDAPQPYKRDLKKAEALLQEADWIDHNGDGVRDKEIDGKRIDFEFTIITSQRQDRIDICTLLKQNLGEIGIKVNVRPMDFTVLQEKTQKHEFQAAFGGWGTGTDPDTSENIWGTNQDRNYGHYSNPRVDELFEKGRRTFDLAEREKIYQEIHRLTYEDQPYMWLYFQNAYYGFNRRLRGYVFSPRGPYSYSPGFSSIWKAAAQP